jgi:hypothetical protein
MKVAALGLAMWLGAAMPAAAQDAGADVTRARQEIGIMESVLEAAVANGADALVRQVRTVMPDMLVLTGAPRARGFRLEGYGVFFDVDVPEMRRSMRWMLRALAETGGLPVGALAQLRATLDLITDPAARADAEAAIQRLERSMAPADPARTVAGAATATPVAGLPPGVDSLVVDDPSTAYTREVQAALVDAMLQNSGSIVLADDEWLTVAARDNYSGEPFVPDSADLPTMVLRISGRDLAAFRAGRLDLDAARTRVERRDH